MIRKFLKGLCSPPLLDLWAAILQRRVSRNVARLDRIQWENIDLDRETVALVQLADAKKVRAAEEYLRRTYHRRIPLPVTWIN